MTLLYDAPNQQWRNKRGLTVLVGEMPPEAPTGLIATAGDGQVGLSWNAATGAAGYNIKRSTSSGSGYVTIESNHQQTSYTDTDVTNDTTYYYVVSAVNEHGESPDSSEMSATPTEAPGGEDPEASWQAAWDSNDQATIDAWYDSHTGIDGYWLEPGELDGTNPIEGRYLEFEDLTEFVGTVSSTHDGQEIKFLYIHGNGAPLNIQHNGVKVIGCFVDPFEAGVGSGGYISLTGGGREDLEFAYCTFRDSYPGPTEDGLRRDWFYALGGIHPGLHIHHCKWPKDNRASLCFALLGSSGTPAKPIVVEYNTMHRERPDPAGRINVFHWLTSLGGECRWWQVRFNSFFSGLPLYNRTGNQGQWQPGDPELLSYVGDSVMDYNLFNAGDRNRGTNIVTAWETNSGGTPALIFWPDSGRTNDFGGPLQNFSFQHNKFGRYSYPWSSRSHIHESLNFHLQHGTNVVFEDNRMLGWGNTLLVGAGNPDTSIDGLRTDWSFNGDPLVPPANSSDGWVRNFGEA